MRSITTHAELAKAFVCSVFEQDRQQSSPDNSCNAGQVVFSANGHGLYSRDADPFDKAEVVPKPAEGEAGWS